MAVIVSPITGKTVSDISGISAIMGMLYEDIEKIIDGAAITLRYPEFERTVSEWGGMVVEGRIPATDGVTPNKNTTTLCGPYYFSVKAEYYDQWIEAAYPSEVRRIELTKILRGEVEYSDFLRKVVQRNIEGYRKDVNKGIDGTLVRADNTPTSGTPISLIEADTNAGTTLSACLTGGNGFLNPSAVGAKQRYDVLEGSDGHGPTYAEYWAAILTECMRMEVENADYTEGTEEWGAQMSDLVIEVPIEVLAHSDIKYIQALFNRAGMDKLPTIKTHNAPAITYTDAQSASRTAYATFILDKRVINHVNRYMAYEQGGIICRFSEQITLHVEHMTKYSPLYKAYAFVCELPTVNEPVEPVEIVSP